MFTSTVRFTRHLVLVILALLASACGGGKSPSASAPASTEPATRPAEPSMKDQLDALEKQGVLPELDRSTDVAGPDADGNGIRDDIDAYIAALPVSDEVKKAVRQRARVQQRSLLIDLKDRVSLLALSDASMASTACMSSTILKDVPSELQYKILRDGHAIALKIEAITANTPERAERYMAYMGALHGTTTTYPTGKVCEDE
ncbi:MULTISPECIES: hypothetical protein [Hydrogenophaga]|uniref:Lipoprotein n=1 Tax=Hydrogenophaga intermedia TaxID=65786 RepID=A0A1L1PI66_HYDIT|nr:MULTISPECIES: hypothetical protein [Hydrogenophaga]CDN89682.1 hypothetical protein BN948_04121 [Hydrogenophaga intermedia]